MSGYRFDRLKVLIADDSPQMRRILTAILNAFGCTDIVEAENADEAWQGLRVSHPDLLILDHLMPGKDGIAFARDVRNAKDSPSPLIPILMLTAHSRLDVVRLARDAGINEFLAKPVTAETLFKRLRTIIEAPRPFVRTKTYFGPDRRRVRKEDYQGPERRADAVKSGNRAS